MCEAKMIETLSSTKEIMLTKISNNFPSIRSQLHFFLEFNAVYQEVNKFLVNNQESIQRIYQTTKVEKIMENSITIEVESIRHP